MIETERSSNIKRSIPASFWFGPRLSFIEIACLKSFIDLGIPIALYSYDPIANVPEGVSLLDAGAIVPREKVFVNKQRQSFAPFSDYFRYKMLQMTEYFWVDTDILALAPFPTDKPYLFAQHHRVMNNAVLALPPKSAVLKDLIDACENPSASLPWLRQSQRDELTKHGHRFEIGDLPYKALGPIALTWLLRKHGFSNQALPTSAIYPFEPRHMLAKARRLLPLITDNCISIHMFNSALRRSLASTDLRFPPEDSFVDALCRRQGVIPSDFPL
jgi:hypothetical protein